MGNRKAFVESLLKDFDQIVPKNNNGEFYRPFFDSLSDKQFESMVIAIENEELVLPLIVPNLSDAKISVKRNLDIGKKWGVEFFHHLMLTDPTNPSVIIKTPKKYLMIKLPVRRQAQTLEKKMAIPDSDRNLDDLSGQVTGDSKGSGISPPEIQILYQHDLKEVIAEFLKVRGGDAEAYRKFEADLVANGHGSLAKAVSGNSSVKAKDTMGSLLKAAHLGNNL